MSFSRKNTVYIEFYPYSLNTGPSNVEPFFKFVNSFLTVEEATDPFWYKCYQNIWSHLFVKIKNKKIFKEIGATFQNIVSCTQCLAQNKVSGLDARGCILHRFFF